MEKKRRKPAGSGTIYYDKKRGRYIGQQMIDGRRRSVYAPTETKARAKLNALVNASAAGEEVASTVTVNTVVNEWLTRDLADRDRAPSTVDRHEWAARKIVDHLGKRKASALTVRHVETMLDALVAADLSRASCDKVLSTLSQSLDFAIRRGDLTHNVAKHARIPTSAARRQPRRALVPDDARTLLTALRHERNGLMFALILRLGLRPGEAAGLYWEDIDDGVVNVTRAIRRVGGRVEVVDDLKTETARRTIGYPPDLEPWIADHRKTQTAERLAARTWADDRLVFTGATGGPLSPSTVRTQLADICKSIGEGFPIMRPNELRHSCASLLADEGVMNEAIADLLGHTTTRMVDSTYRHRLRPVVDVAAHAGWATDGA